MGCIITTVSYLLVASGGINSVRGMFVLIGLLISAIMIMCIVASFKLAIRCLGEKKHGFVESEDEEAELIVATEV